MKVKSLFKQVDEKHLHGEVELMLWSPKMDLIALSMAAGEVCLFRLSWQKVWSVPKKNENVFVSSLAWRPDGKVLAIGYTNGEVCLHSIEDASLIISHDVSDKAIASMCWVEDSTISKSSTDIANHFGGLELHDGFKDLSSEYLPELPPLQNSQESSKPDDIKKLKGSKNLNILAVGTSKSYIILFAYGIIPIGYIHISNCVREILNVSLSDKLALFNVIGLSKDSDDVVLVTYDCEGLCQNNEEIKLMSLKLGEVLSLINYMFEVIKQMSEVWEDILLEIESKLKKFARDKFQASGHTLRYELLRLLLYGYPSDDLKLFLQFDLKKQAFTKLGNSVQNSYSQIQKLLVKNFAIVTEKILFHLNGLLGMARWHDRFQHLGLDETLLEKAISTAGALMMKSNEMQRVIDVSIKNFVAFYKWLYPIKQKLSGEVSLPNLGNLSQQEINFVAQFINENFTSYDDVKLEKVGQYLKNEDLPNPIFTSNTPWETFLDQIGYNLNSSVRTFFYDSCKGNSLVQVAKMLKKNFAVLLTTCATKIKDYFKITEKLNLNYSSFQSTSAIGSDDVTGIKFSITSMNVATDASETCMLYTMVCRPVDKKTFYLMQKGMQNVLSIAKFSFIEPGRVEPYDLIDVSFYDNNVISILLQDENSPRVVQFNISQLLSCLKNATCGMNLNDVPHEVVSEKVEEGERCKVLENMRVSKFAISGMRKVACVLFSSKKRVRIFLIDVEEDDDDDDASNNISKLSCQDDGDNNNNNNDNDEGGDDNDEMKVDDCGDGDGDPKIESGFNKENSGTV